MQKLESMRMVTALEIISVVLSVVITVWAIIPMQPPYRWMWAIPGLLAIVLIVNSQIVRGETLRDLGLSMRYFTKAVKLLILPTIMAAVLFVSIGLMTKSYQQYSSFRPAMILLPVWGLFQQYILQAFIYRRVRYLVAGGMVPEADGSLRVNLAVLATAAIFSLAHAPNPALMGFTFLGGLVWSWIYERAPNLPALALSHGFMSVLVMTALPHWVMDSMSIGYKHFLYQKF